MYKQKSLQFQNEFVILDEHLIIWTWKASEVFERIIAVRERRLLSEEEL